MNYEKNDLQHNREKGKEKKKNCRIEGRDGFWLRKLQVACRMQSESKNKLKEKGIEDSAAHARVKLEKTKSD